MAFYRDGQDGYDMDSSFGISGGTAMDVSGKIAIVTGGGRGIGRGISLALARNGADIVIADIIVKNAEGVADETRNPSREMTAQALSEFGAIDILVNNAGVIGAQGWESRETPNEEDWDFIFEINVKGIARVTDAISPHMQGAQGSSRNPPYNVSKAGVISLTQGQAQGLAPHNINVNAICPGLLWTPMWERITARAAMTPNPGEKTQRELFEENVQRTIPLGREQTPDDIGNLAAFLASEYAMNITGQSINVSGGLHMN
ncbi:3-oxoacyl-[acyl-carrier-protein] reductase FabG [Geodia barretti]|uniref:3-ketoacyl-[acyl-carrier-protein] reductase beta subunit n=1 Tax=Geodia barretti TaxID=519541 RepID=A0AA35TLY1_GEOBA|nr:3-oxoacyl-[acyl-carrier-protein] reductase FabG [Geodia barretti]